MEELGWIVEINSYLDTNNVLNRSIPFNNVIATLDEKVRTFLKKLMAPKYIKK